MMNNTERNFLTPESHEQLDLQGRDVIYSCTGAVFKHLTGSPIAPPLLLQGGVKLPPTATLRLYYRNNNLCQG